MKNCIYISDGKKFVWKAQILAHRIDPEDICKYCNGSGKISRGFGGIVDDDDGTCNHCGGIGKMYWFSPNFQDKEIADALQKKLNELIEEKNNFLKNNPPFIGIGI